MKNKFGSEFYIKSPILHEMHYRELVKELVRHVTYIVILNLAKKLYGCIGHVTSCHVTSIFLVKSSGEPGLVLWPQDVSFPATFSGYLNWCIGYVTLVSH